MLRNNESRRVVPNCGTTLRYSAPDSEGLSVAKGVFTSRAAALQSAIPPAPEEFHKPHVALDL
jgi:hypothetical protein